MSEPDGRALAGVIRGAAVALAGSVLGGGLGFAFSVLMGRMLGTGDFGLFVLALNFVTAGAWIGIAGADFATIRFVSAAETPGAKRGAMRTPLLLVLGFVTLLSLALLALAEPIAEGLLHEPRFTNALRAISVVLPLTVAAQMLSAALSGLEQAKGEFARKVAEQGGRILFGSLAVVGGLGVVGVVFGMAAGAAVAIAVVGWLLLRSLPRGGETERLPARDVLAFAWPQTIAGVARRFWELANLAILARYEPASTVALFGAALAIAQLPQMIYNSFAFRFSPTISRLWARGERDELEEMLHSVTRWVSVASVPFYAVAIVLPAPLLLIYGEEFRGAATALVLVAVASLVNSLTGPVEWALIMTGRVRLEMAANVAVVAASVVLALVLTPRYGLTGAGICVLAQFAGVNIVKSLMVWRALRMHTLSTGLARPLVAAAIAAAAALALERTTGLGESLPGAFLLGSVLIAAYAAATAAGVGISREDRRALAIALRRSS